MRRGVPWEGREEGEGEEEEEEEEGGGGFEDILGGGLSPDWFRSAVWGQRVHAWAIESAGVFERLSAGFHHGDVSAIMGECRHEDNTCYTPEEISGLEEGFNNGARKRLVLDFCFSPGAQRLRAAFLQSFGDLGNDVEVGVYCSKVGSDPSGWHYDNNHNVTIQLTGTKDWHVLPGTPDTVSSRAMVDPPRNRHEQQINIPRAGMGGGGVGAPCYSLAPGSVLYVPPGTWHQVTPVEGPDAVSVDIRVGNVAASKWIAEAIFACLLEDFGGPGPASAAPWGDWTPGTAPLGGPVTPGDLVSGAAPSGGVASQAAAAVQGLQALSACGLPGMLERCRIPRCIPDEPEASDGLRRGADLQFLVERGWMAPLDLTRGAAGRTVGINPLVALAVKHRNGTAVAVDLTSVSSLSGMEYLRFTLSAPAAMYGPLARLARHGKATVEELMGELGGGGVAELGQILRVLVHANVLWHTTAGRGAGGTSKKRPRR